MIYQYPVAPQTQWYESEELDPLLPTVANTGVRNGAWGISGI